ncbi:MAG: hypothetical protein ACM3S5_18320 [Rhodospirillales bacterium]
MRLEKRRSGGILAGVLAAILVLALLLVGTAILLGLFIARNVRVEETSSGRGKVVRIETPVGSMRVREARSPDDLRRLGLPVYPGAAAVPGEGKTVNLEFQLGDEKNLNVAAADYTTADSIANVSAFYRQELPDWSFSMHDGRVEMRHSEEGYQKVIAIREKGGLTRISLVQIGEPQEN